eukprot:1288390-Pleurochrysis_carterae.AAC.1
MLPYDEPTLQNTVYIASGSTVTQFADTGNVLVDCSSQTVECIDESPNSTYCNPNIVLVGHDTETLDSIINFVTLPSGSGDDPCVLQSSNESVVGEEGGVTDCVVDIDGYNATSDRFDVMLYSTEANTTAVDV